MWVWQDSMHLLHSVLLLAMSAGHVAAHEGRDPTHTGVPALGLHTSASVSNNRVANVQRRVRTERPEVSTHHTTLWSAKQTTTKKEGERAMESRREGKDGGEGEREKARAGESGKERERRRALLSEGEGGSKRNKRERERERERESKAAL